MANVHRGEIGFEADGKSYVLSYSANALVEVEDAFELKSITEISAVLNEGLSMRALRTLFRLGLIDSDPDIDEQEAGVLMTAVGITRAAQLIAEAIQAAFPKGDASGAGNPPKKPRGTGASLK